MVKKSFWKNRRVFITGHTGFKGAWLTAWLKKMDAEIAGFSLPPPTTPSLFKSADLGSGILSVQGDVRDLEALGSCLEKFSPEVVFHLAAQSLVRKSYRDPVETYQTNIMGTVHLLESIRRCPSVKAVIVVTSDKCYENREWVWGYRERDPLGGSDPYSSSKGCAEIITTAYRKSYFTQGNKTGSIAGSSGSLGIASVRAGNVIGGGDWAEDRLIPDIVRAIQKGRELIIRNPNATRPWQHVLDPLAGYLQLAERILSASDKYSGPWNFGPPAHGNVSVLRVLENFYHFWDIQPNWKTPDETQPDESQTLNLDCSKAIYHLGWRPHLDLMTSLKWTSEWYKAFYSNPENARNMTELQIERYISERDFNGK